MPTRRVLLTLAFLTLLIAPAAIAAQSALPGARALDDYLPVTWRVSPPMFCWAIPADAAGRPWYDPAFDDSEWEIVTLPDSAIAAGASRFYRAHLDLPGPLPQAVLRLKLRAGGNAYVNGEYVFHWGDDVCRTTVRDVTPPDTDLTPWLKTGNNVLAVHVAAPPSETESSGRLDAKIRTGAGRVWTRYHGNPVVDMGLSGNWDKAGVEAPSVLADDGGFRMWYASSRPQPQIGLALSKDGIYWHAYNDQPVLRRGTDGTWDDEGVYEPSVVRDDGGYKLYYSGYDGQTWRIGLATSTDGVTWTKHPAPVLKLGGEGAFDSMGQHSPTVHFDGRRYRVWYEGYDGSMNRLGLAVSADGVTWFKSPANPVYPHGWGAASDGPLDPIVLQRNGQWEMWYTWENIWRATSSDGVTWTSQDVVLSSSGNREWDLALEAPMVVFDGQQYHMWYGGWDHGMRIGYASSPDGITWQKRPSAVLRQRPGSYYWDEWSIGRASILEEPDGSLRMFYSGHYGRWLIGLATSQDGLIWERLPDHQMVLYEGPQRWDSVEVFSPYVIREGEKLSMWYTGWDRGPSYRIGYASSTDNGRTWAKSPENPVLDVGPAGSFDSRSVQGASVIKEDDGTYRMWYMGQEGTKWQLGLATSPDGLHWTRYEGNPVFTVAAPGAWDSTHIYWAHVIKGGPGYQMWYTGTGAPAGQPGLATGHRIGYAESADGINWTRSAVNPVTDYLPYEQYGWADQFEPFVLRQGNLYRMWYTERDRWGGYLLSYAWSAIPEEEVTPMPDATPTATVTATPTVPKTPAAPPVYLPVIVGSG